MEEQSAGPMAFKNLRSSHWHLVYEPPSSHFIGSLCEAIQCDQICQKSFLNKIYVRRLETVLNLLWQFFTLLGSLALLKRAKYWTTIFPGLFFFIFIFSIPLTVNQFTSKFADDWSRTTDLWCRKQLLCQLRHNHYPWTNLVHGHLVPLSARPSLSGSLHDSWIASLLREREREKERERKRERK